MHNHIDVHKTKSSFRRQSLKSMSFPFLISLVPFPETQLAACAFPSEVTELFYKNIRRTLRDASPVCRCSLSYMLLLGALKFAERSR